MILGKRYVESKNNLLPISLRVYCSTISSISTFIVKGVIIVCDVLPQEETLLPNIGIAAIQDVRD